MRRERRQLASHVPYAACIPAELEISCMLVLTGKMTIEVIIRSQRKLQEARQDETDLPEAGRAENKWPL